MAELTDRQRVFADEYLVDLNATQAAIRAGYAPSTAPKQGRRLRQLPAVAAIIEARMRARSERLAMEADTVLREMFRLAMARPADVFCITEDDTGELCVRIRPSRDWTEDSQASVAKVREHVSAHGIKSLEIGFNLQVKQRALERVGAHLGLWGLGGDDSDDDEGAIKRLVLVPAKLTVDQWLALARKHKDEEKGQAAAPKSAAKTRPGSRTEGRSTS